MSSKVLVTGGAGYVGSHACKAVAAAGYTPITYDNLVTGHRQAVRWGPLEIGDILDRIRLDEVLKRHRPDAILHFAASIQVGESVRDPGKYYRNNVVGSLTLLEAVRDHGVPVFVLSSTAAVYGDVSAVPVTESHEMARRIEEAGGDVRLTVYEDAEHDSWTRTYEDPRLYAWLLEHRRG